MPPTLRPISAAARSCSASRLHESQQAWERAARARLLQAPALHADETGLWVDGKVHWLHVLTNGSLTLKFLHRKRGKKAIQAIGLIPRYGGTLVHDCWASLLSYRPCRHQPRRSQLLRELTVIIESNNYRWARLLKALLQQACHKLDRSQTMVVSKAAFKAVRKRYRTILTQGAKELPEIPPRSKGQRGRAAESDAHTLHERFVKHEESVLRFLRDAHLSITKDVGERAMRMPRSKSGSRAAFARKPTVRPMPASPATCSRWPRSATILSSPSKSRLPAKLPTWSSNTMARR